MLHTVEMQRIIHLKEKEFSETATWEARKAYMKGILTRLAANQKNQIHKNRLKNIERVNKR